MGGGEEDGSVLVFFLSVFFWAGGELYVVWIWEGVGGGVGGFAVGLASCPHMSVMSLRSWIPAFRVWAHLLGVGFDGSLPVGWLWLGSL